MKKDRSLFIKGAALIFAAALVFAGCKPEPDVPDTPDTPDTPVEVTKYTVTFNSDGGSEIAAVEVEANATVAEPETAPTKDGYTFGGWYNGEAAYDFETPVTSDLTLKASWAINKYKVTFDLNGGSGDAPAEQTIEYGKTVTEPTAPTKADGEDGTVYTFAGWTTVKNDVSTVFVFNTEVKTDIALYALWSDAPVYTVTLELNYEDSVPVTVKALDSTNYIIAAPTATREGYALEGWYKDKDLTKKVDFAEEIFNADTKIYAKWTIKTYTVSFDLNGGSGTAPATQTINHGELATEPTQPKKSGYNFGGWYTNAEGTGTAFSFAVAIKENVVLYATWTTAPVYTVKLDYNYREKTSSLQATQNNNYTLTSPEATRYSYELVGWYTDAELTKPATFPLTVSKNMTLYAKWKGIIKVKKGVASNITIPKNPNGNNYQNQTEIFAPNSTYVADKGDKISITIKGTPDMDINELKCVLIDTSEAAGYWKVLSNYAEIGYLKANEEFESTVELTMSDSGVTAGSYQKLVLMYDLASNQYSSQTYTNLAQEAHIDVTMFAINNKESKPTLDLATATVIQDWTYASVASDDNWSINGNVEGVTSLNADDIYLVITIITSGEAHHGWGGGCLVNYEGGENPFIELNVGNEIGSRDVIYTLEEVYDAMIEFGLEEPGYFKFNWWDANGSIDRIRLMK